MTAIEGASVVSVLNARVQDHANEEGGILIMSLLDVGVSATRGHLPTSGGEFLEILSMGTFFLCRKGPFTRSQHRCTHTISRLHFPFDNGRCSLVFCVTPKRTPTDLGQNRTSDYRLKSQREGCGRCIMSIPSTVKRPL